MLNSQLLLRQSILRMPRLSKRKGSISTAEIMLDDVAS
jgi:hypothetical protein